VCNGLRGLKWVQTCIAWDCEVWCIVLGVWRYQRGNQNPYIEEEQTTQWPKEKGQTTIYKTYP
jgi:hypothetical protein